MLTVPLPDPDEEYGADAPDPPIEMNGSAARDSAPLDDSFDDFDDDFDDEWNDDPGEGDPAPSQGGEMDDDIPEDVLDEIIGQATNYDGPGGLVFECMADVEPQAVEWMWRNRIARGKLTLIAGEPAIGKSQISLDIAARISTGDMWPDDGCAEAGRVIILSAEDSANDTIRPRLEAAGAELSRIINLKAAIGTDGKRRTFSLQADLDQLGKKITVLGDVSLIIIDPITSYMGKIDSHRTTDVRDVLEPLADLAERFNVGVVAITHPPKAAQAKALHAVTGSLAFVAAPRLVFIAIEEAETERRLLLAVKNNLGPLADGLGFRLGQRCVTADIVASHVVWDHAPVDVNANEALAAACQRRAAAVTA
jgi:AAA domain-containing protein